MPHTSDTRILGYEPLLSPAALLEELPLGPAEADMVERSRAEVRAVLDGEDDRLVVVVGPCSVHDPAAGRTTPAASPRGATRRRDWRWSCGSTSRSRARR